MTVKAIRRIKVSLKAHDETKTFLSAHEDPLVARKDYSASIQNTSQHQASQHVVQAAPRLASPAVMRPLPSSRCLLHIRQGQTSDTVRYTSSCKLTFMTPPILGRILRYQQGRPHHATSFLHYNSSFQTTYQLPTLSPHQSISPSDVLSLLST